MNSVHTLRLSAAGMVAALLVACGSGGGGDSGTGPTQPNTPPPSSGLYSWLLKAEGATDSLKYGLSLVHPSDPNTEYVIEPANAAVTDAKLVASATVDTTALRTGTLKPFALIYIVGGDVRRVSLEANGSAPASRVSKANTSSACAFVLDAVNYTAPEQSRFVVSTAGTDGKCGTADDGRSEVRLDATVGVALTPLQADAAVATLRDPASLSPRGWLGRTRATLWSTSPATSLQIRPDNDPLGRVVLSTAKSALVESPEGLSVISFSSGNSFNETRLASASGTGWQAIGYDKQNFYAYRNGNTAGALNWSVVKVTRGATTSTTLASGAGEISLASMGVDVLYINVLGANTQELRRVLKAVPGASQLLESGAALSTLTTVLTSSSGVHLLWRLTGLGSETPSYAVEMVDESGTKLYRANAGAFSLGLADAATVDFDTSESRTRFMFVEGYGARFFGDATLVSYDTATRAATRLGTLPGSTDFGNDLVFANVVSGPAPFATGFASRSINGVLQAAGTKVFSFDAATPGSLKISARQK
jgi:hypothetical protein